jgi:16S rRNA (guanine966-N2)-methyltransferase
MLGDMRIIAGEGKGRRLRSARTSVRPTTALVRGAIFSILYPMLDQDWQALDLYAGTGALGIEALSRGAGWADFVESEPKCCDIIKENLEKTRLSAQAHVYCMNALKALSFLDKEYNIILMDPPYANASTGDFITQLALSRLVGDKTTVVVTHSSRLPLNQTYAALNLIKEHRHGDSCIALFHKEAKR